MLDHRGIENNNIIENIKVWIMQLSYVIVRITITNALLSYKISHLEKIQFYEAAVPFKTCINLLWAIH